MTWQRFVTALLAASLCACVNGATVKVAWLAPEDDQDGMRASSSVGSLAMAIDNMEADSDILPGDVFA